MVNRPLQTFTVITLHFLDS